MVDCGAERSFISPRIRHRIPVEGLEQPVNVRNIDGTVNRGGPIRYRTNITTGVYGRWTEQTYWVADIGEDDLILGLDWLTKVNPVIDWKARRVETLPPVRIAAGHSRSQEIAEERKLEEAKRPFEEIVPKEFRDFADVFSEQKATRMPTRKPYDHEIKLTKDAKLPRSRVYPLAPKEKEAVKEYIRENLAKGYIRPSNSPNSSSVFFIKKKDGGLRFVVDYRKLNDVTVKDRYPLPLTQVLLEGLAKAKHFTTLDLRSGYNNIRIKEGDESKAAFVTEEGLFEPLVMGFGLCNAPATFQRMMNEIFYDLLGKGVEIYLDDIMIYTETREEHIRIIREVLKRLRQNDLFLKPEKCFFLKKEVEYLGFRVSHNQIIMDQEKVKAIQDWPIPKNIKGMQSFLGFANFY